MGLANGWASQAASSQGRARSSGARDMGEPPAQPPKQEPAHRHTCDRRRRSPEFDNIVATWAANVGGRGTLAGFRDRSVGRSRALLGAAHRGRCGTLSGFRAKTKQTKKPREAGAARGFVGSDGDAY